MSMDEINTHSSLGILHDLVAFDPLAFKLRLERDLGCAQSEVLDVERGDVRVQLFYLRA